MLILKVTSENVAKIAVSTNFGGKQEIMHFRRFIVDFSVITPNGSSNLSRLMRKTRSFVWYKNLDKFEVSQCCEKWSQYAPVAVNINAKPKNSKCLVSCISRKLPLPNKVRLLVKVDNRLGHHSVSRQTIDTWLPDLVFLHEEHFSVSTFYGTPYTQVSLSWVNWYHIWVVLSLHLATSYISDYIFSPKFQNVYIKLYIFLVQLVLWPLLSTLTCLLSVTLVP